MLHEWIAPMPVAAFVRTHLHKQPYASPGAARRVGPLFEWTALARVLVAEPPPDVIVVTNGKLVDAPAPRTVAEAHTLLQRGVGLVIRRAEHHDAGLAELAASFVGDLPGEAHVQLFVTPTGAHSYGMGPPCASGRQTYTCLWRLGWPRPSWLFPLPFIMPPYHLSETTTYFLSDDTGSVLSIVQPLLTRVFRRLSLAGRELWVDE